MDVVSAIEACGTRSGQPTAVARIVGCGILASDRSDAAEEDDEEGEEGLSVLEEELMEKRERDWRMEQRNGGEVELNEESANELSENERELSHENNDNNENENNENNDNNDNNDNNEIENDNNENNDNNDNDNEIESNESSELSESRDSLSDFEHSDEQTFGGAQRANLRGQSDRLGLSARSANRADAFDEEFDDFEETDESGENDDKGEAEKGGKRGKARLRSRV